MELYESSIELATLLETNRVVYVRTEPEVLDFTDLVVSKIVIFGQGNSKVELEISSSNAAQVMGIIDATIFDKEMVDRVYFWDFKSLASFCKYHITKFVTPKNTVLDLKVIEYFLGNHKKPPENFLEAANRVGIIAQNKDWPAIYKSIHMPLMLRVLPSIESTALLNSELRRSEHPCYEIEGQVNGRLNCSKKFSKSYLPHNMSEQIKSNMKPKGYGLCFSTADFRFCEVVVLQWLSGDPKLKEIIDSGQDFHTRVYEMITNMPCDTPVKRTISKRMFLPIMYGLGTTGLAKYLGVPEAVADPLRHRVLKTFTTAVQWIEGYQERARHGETVKDYFGRPRKYKPEEAYLVRNFVVQAPAATLCQEKLIDLWRAFDNTDNKIAYSVHDGFCVVFPLNNAKEVYTTMKDTLEAESKLCQGLRMRVEIEFGDKLNAMRVVK